MKKKLFYIVNHASFFVSHRLPIAIEANKNNYEVFIIFGKASSQKTEPDAIKKILNSNIKFIKVNINNQKIFRIFDLIGLIQIIYLMIKYKPQIVHSISPIANIISSIAIIFFKNISYIISISGMGYIFTGKNFLKKFFVFIYLFIFNNIAKKNKLMIIVQNNDDYRYFTHKFNLINKITLIQGSGVNLSLYKDVNFLNKKKIILLPARIIKEKGIYEFIEASKRIYKINKNWQFILVGQDDYKSPSAINLRQLFNDGISSFIFRGYVEELSKTFIESSIVCLPSYREGMPKVLLEASAAGCAIITTDTIGCRDSIIDGFSGELVKLKDINNLTDTILKFIEDKKLREKYGKNAREYAFNNYSIDMVIEKHLNIYKKFNEEKK